MIYTNIRILIAKECEKISKLSGEIEIDESYFGAKRVRGKRGMGVGKKNTCIFALFHLQLQAEWAMPNIRLSTFGGVSKNNFILHLKETEFR